MLSVRRACCDWAQVSSRPPGIISVALLTRENGVQGEGFRASSSLFLSLPG